MSYSVYDATPKHESSCLDSIRHSRLHDGNNDAANATISQSLERYTALASQHTTLETLTNVLKWTGLPGPAVLIDRQYIGSGSQFVVYRQALAWTERGNGYFHRNVASKYPKIPLDRKTKLNLAQPEVPQYLQPVLLEILALRDPRLREHPNIASLIGWSFDSRVFHQPLGLLMELADQNLATYLEKDAINLPLSSKYRICVDIASGIDALHDCKIIHGDLKPGNVLLYRERDRLVAKLADFGLSVEESACKEKAARLAGTPGWQAPEVEAGRMLRLDELPRADNYSFGLLVWSILLYSGKAPPYSAESRQAIASREIQDFLDGFSLNSYSCLPPAVFNLLYEVNQRPLRVEELFNEEMEDECVRSEPSLSKTEDVERKSELPPSHTHQNNTKKFSWEQPLLNGIFATDLYSRFQQDPESISDDRLFAMYLAYTNSPPKAVDPQMAVLDVLVSSALRGYEPAQAVVLAAFESFGYELPPSVKSRIPEWLERGVVSGSFSAGTRLKQSNPAAFAVSRAKFRTMGGYNWLYCAIPISRTNLGVAWEKGYSKLHWLATYGEVEDLLEYLDSEDGYCINSMTENEETPLYLACARGSWKIASALLEYGACPSTKCTSFRISCMHWLFSFETEFQELAVTRFIRYGADIDAVTLQEVPLFHYPFVLPPGSPLHWAVAASSYETISVLIENGSDVTLRNGADPYIFDYRVREMNRFDGPDQQLSSTTEITTQGLSPLDLSAIQYDPFIFDTLLRLSKSIDINTVDEEGFSVLHRLSTKPQGRTRAGQVFNTMAFRGGKKIREENLNRTIMAIRALGGDLEQLTTPSVPRTGDWVSPTFTPLMLALLHPCPAVIRALSESGASVHTENNLGETALHCLPSQDVASSGECAQLLISHGADVNHKNEYGEGPVLKAAQYGLLDVVEAMLCAGADVDERVRSTKSRRAGANFFAFCARLTREEKYNEDILVARLLHTHVFTCHDVEKRRRIVEVGDLTGETLLHCFAMSCMPRCVAALLDHGAPVNAKRKKFTIATKSTGAGVTSIRYETPFNAAVECQARWESEMIKYRQWSAETYAQICRKQNKIIAMLEKADGISIRAIVLDS